MERTVPFFIMMLLFGLGLAYYLAYRRQEIARARTLARRIQPLDRILPRAEPRIEALGREPYPISLAVERWLVQAGIEISPAAFLALIVSLGALATALTSLRFRLPLALLGGVGFAAVPIMLATFARRRRLRTFSHQLPYVLDFLRSSLQAGHTLLRGLQMSSESAPEPMASELRLALEQIRVGVSLPDALENMLKRVPEGSLEFFVVAVRIQARVGSSVAEILDRVTDALRERERLQSEMRTLTAQARMSGIIVGLLPFFLLALFMLIRPSYTGILFRDPIGIKMLEAAIVLDVLALLIIRRLVRVD